MTHLTDERLDQLKQGLDVMNDGARASTCYHPDVVDDLITALRRERAAHQATRAELDAAREAASELVWSIEDCFERGLLTLGEVTEQEIRGRIRHWKDAARAGQGEGH